MVGRGDVEVVDELDTCDVRAIEELNVVEIDDVVDDTELEEDSKDELLEEALPGSVTFE